MAFDTFDEGVTLGGMRSKNEIRTLICYLFGSVNEPMSKDTITEAVQQESLANYFETSSCFDDLVTNGNLKKVDGDNSNPLFVLTEKGQLIANELDSTIPYTVKDKAYSCAIKLLAQKKNERENTVEIKKTDLGYDVVCKISGGNVDLLSMTLFAPDMEQALILKKNFYESPITIYKVMLALLTKNKESVGEALEDLYGILS